MFKSCVRAILFGVVVSMSYGQSDHWEVVLEDGRMVSHVILMGVDADSLLVRRGETTRSVPISELAVIRYVRSSDFWSGAGTGALIGASAGLVFGAFFFTGKTGPDIFDESSNADVSLNKGLMWAAIGATVGGLAGGVVEGTSGMDDTYDFSGESLSLKKKLLQVFFAEQRRQAKR